MWDHFRSIHSATAPPALKHSHQNLRKRAAGVYNTRAVVWKYTSTPDLQLCEGPKRRGRHTAQRPQIRKVMQPISEEDRMQLQCKGALSCSADARAGTDRCWFYIELRRLLNQLRPRQTNTANEPARVASVGKEKAQLQAEGG